MNKLERIISKNLRRLDFISTDSTYESISETYNTSTGVVTVSSTDYNIKAIVQSRKSRVKDGADVPSDSKRILIYSSIDSVSSIEPKIHDKLDMGSSSFLIDLIYEVNSAFIVVRGRKL